jgi:RNA polymerase sigma factor (sigma-70 family)
MATNRLRKALNHLQLALAPPGAEALTDAQLLARFLASRDEAVFAVLVRRHGPMVLGVCRRVLRHAQDAEDAFQATFFVLARKAGSVLKREAVGSWLYMVAYRAAQRARARQARRRVRERQVDAMPHPQVQPEELRDWLPLLDDELGRLPQKYRAPVVLCDLEGQSRREAARQLKLPDGTLSSRLATGRRLLAERLSRRGVALSGGALAVALAEGASAAVPAPWVSATAQAAASVAAGQAGAVVTPAAVLMNEVLRTMFITKLKVYVATALVAVLLGVGGLAYQAAGQAPQGGARPLTDLEALRREVEILKLQVEVLQAKVRAQEVELRDLRGKATAATRKLLDDKLRQAARDEAARQREVDALAQQFEDALKALGKEEDDAARRRELKALAQQFEDALKAQEKAKGKGPQERALGELERALRQLREHLRRVPDNDPNAAARQRRQRAIEALDRAFRELSEQLRQPGDSAPQPENAPAKKKL